MPENFEKISSKNTALVVIDVVNGCAHEKCEDLDLGITFSKIRGIVPKLLSFIEDYRKNIGGMVVFTNTVPWQKKFLPNNINELYKNPKARYYSDDNSGFSEDFYIIAPQKHDVVITKNNYDAFSNTDLQSVLNKNKIKNLIISGVFGDGCVLATICGGFSRGYNIIMISDLIETTDVKIRQDIQALLKKYTWPIMYGKTINADDFINNWNGY